MQASDGRRTLRAFEATVDNAVHGHALHASRHDGHAETSSDKAQGRCDAGRLWPRRGLKPDLRQAAIVAS